jgi:N-acetylmuramoyl-L-alanine amidase
MDYWGRSEAIIYKMESPSHNAANIKTHPKKGAPQMTGSDVKWIVIHCADTYARMDIGAKEIDQWHKQNGWIGIGYHFAIRRNGVIEPGRPVNMGLSLGWEIMQGAHVASYNSSSVGVCLVGGKGDTGKPESNYTEQQWDTLKLLIWTLTRCFPGAKVVGHTNLDPGKACPCFDVPKWWSSIVGEVGN